MKHAAKALVECNDYATYTMDDVPPLLDYKVILPKGKFNGLHTHYSIRLDPDLCAKSSWGGRGSSRALT